MPTLSGLGGLASGVDTDAIVQKLLAVERQPEARLKLDQQRAQARQTLLRDIAGRLRSLRDAATDLRLGTSWSTTQTTSSSDPNRLAVARTAGASPGLHRITVAELASTEQRTLSFTDPAAATQLTITGAEAGAKPATIDVAAKATAQDVADAINGRADAAAYAVVVAGQLVLSSRTAGEGRGFTVSSADSTFTEVTASHREGKDARYRVDGGVEQTSKSNVVQNAIAGLTLTLVAPTLSDELDPVTGEPKDSPVTVTVGDPQLDTNTVKNNLKAFVDKYNETTSFIRGKLTEHRDAKATGGPDAMKGLLEGDSMLTGLLSQLRRTIAEPLEGMGDSQRDSLSEIGISTGDPAGSGSFSPDAVAGKLTLNDGALAAALSADAVGVRKLLGGVTGTSGFAQRFEAVLSAPPGADSARGPLELLGLRADQASGQAMRLGADVDDMEKRIALKESRLRAMFLAMEQAMQASQSQSQWLAQQLR